MPEIDSMRDDLPELCDPITTIWGMSKSRCALITKVYTTRFRSEENRRTLDSAAGLKHPTFASGLRTLWDRTNPRIQALNFDSLGLMDHDSLEVHWE